jgi:3,4-dihydroxy 2-butanone 4-phosphate synthase/GTP cyclohydrolase II
MVIIVDDEDRENEGDLVCAAECVTPEIINFMATHARGLICMPLTEERCDELHLTMQVADNTSFLGTAFTVSIEARRGVTTGISAADRATTILTAVDPKTKPSDLARPGHIFPLRARKGGVLVRPGQTEASVDLARIAGLYPAGVICEIMNADGTMARLPELREFAREHDLKIISVAALVRYRMQKETLVRRAAQAEIKTVYGQFQAVAFENVINSEVHLAMVMGDVRTPDEPGARARPHGEHHGRRVRVADGRHEFSVAHGLREDRGGGARRRALSQAAPARTRSAAPASHLRADARTQPHFRGSEH